MLTDKFTSASHFLMTYGATILFTGKMPGLPKGRGVSLRRRPLRASSAVWAIPRREGKIRCAARAKKIIVSRTFPQQQQVRLWTHQVLQASS